MNDLIIVHVNNKDSSEILRNYVYLLLFRKFYSNRRMCTSNKITDLFI